MSTVPQWNGGLAVARARTANLAAAVEQAIDGACKYLFNRQNPEGYWVGELEADTSLESDYVALQLWLYQPDADGLWTPPTRQRVDAACRRILDRQLPDGGWNIYASGPANVSASVKAYFALKVAGLNANDERMRRAKAKILELGGVEATNSYTKIYLSYFEQYSRAKVASIPPEIFFTPCEQPVQYLRDVVVEPRNPSASIDTQRQEGLETGSARFSHRRDFFRCRA